MKNCFKSIKMLVKKFPLYIVEEIFSCFLLVLQSVIPIYAMNDIIKIYKTNGDNVIKDIIIYILIRFTILVLIEIVLYIFELYKMRVERLFIGKTSELFYKKLSHIDYDFHENPMFLNDYTRSLEEGVNNIYRVANGTLNTLKILIQSFSIFIIISEMDYRIIIIAFSLGILYLLICLRIGVLSKKMRKEYREYSRMSWYSNRAFTIKDGMADIKTSDIDKILIENNENSLDKSVKVVDKYATRISLLKFMGDVLLALLYPIILALLAYLTTDIESNIASFASLTVAASTLSSLINKLASSLGEVESVLPDCKVPFDVLSMKGNIENSNLDKKFDSKFISLDIKNISFSYSGKENQLEDINISIKKGEHIAIVGSNGAGKTTLVKLLLRLYDPSAGSIKINGEDYKDINPKDLRKKVGAVFQNVETYAVTIAENILLRKPITKEDFELIDKSLKFSDLYDYVYSLKDGINTEISREFQSTGAIFSGGQNQRLAIARGYAQNYELFILDEPSSALDPIAEAKVYKNMLELGHDKTIIFISHRLTTTINADKIYLFDNGHIIESGTHEELMKLNKVYHRMFSSQSSKYIGENYE